MAILTETTRRPTAAKTSVGIRYPDGTTATIDLDEVVTVVARQCDGLDDVDPSWVATKTVNGLYDGVAAEEVDRLLIQTAAEMIGEEPQYSRLAARLLSRHIDEEIRSQGVARFSDAIALGLAEKLIGEDTAAFVAANAAALDQAVDATNDRRFEYFGLRTVYDRYLLRHPTTRKVFETPQYWLLRVRRLVGDRRGRRALLPSHVLAVLPAELAHVVQLGHRHPQLSSCFLVDSPRDELDSIYERYARGGEAVEVRRRYRHRLSRVRSRGSLIRRRTAIRTGSCPG